MQQTVAQSTYEAEYTALNLATREGLFIAQLLADAYQIAESLQSHTSVPLSIYCDNGRLVDSLLSGSIIGTRAVRHLRIKVHWLKEIIDDPQVDFSHVPGPENPADLFTKPLTESEITKYCAMFNFG